MSRGKEEEEIERDTGREGEEKPLHFRKMLRKQPSVHEKVV